PHLATRKLRHGLEPRRDARHLAERLGSEDVATARNDADQHGGPAAEELVDAIVDLNVRVPLREEIVLVDTEPEPQRAGPEQPDHGQDTGDEGHRMPDHELA